MSFAKILDYTEIDRPYSASLERTESTVVEVQSSVVQDTAATASFSSASSASSTTTGLTTSHNGNIEIQPVKSDGGMSDVWIKNFIRSENWKPKTVGFYIDGQTGKAEFSNVYVSGNIQALTGNIGGFTIGATDLSATDGTNTTIISSGDTAFTAGPTGAPTVTITQDGALTVSFGMIANWIISDNALYTGEAGIMGTVDTMYFGDDGLSLSDVFSVTPEGLLTSTSGYIAGWTINSTSLSSEASGARIELDRAGNRISVFDVLNEKVVMGYLDGLPKNDGTGDWGAADYGFWARSGDKLSIDGDGEYISGDWIIQNDASYLVNNSSGNTVVRLGSDSGQKGVFIYDTAGTQLARFASDEIFLGDATKFLKYTTAAGLEVGKIDVGTLGQILGGQTDYSVGTGFFLGYSGAAHKFSLGSSTNYLRWDGSDLILRGSFGVGDDGIINNAVYTVANLPVVPGTEGFNPPTAYE